MICTPSSQLRPAPPHISVHLPWAHTHTITTEKRPEALKQLDNGNKRCENKRIGSRRESSHWKNGTVNVRFPYPPCRCRGRCRCRCRPLPPTPLALTIVLLRPAFCPTNPSPTPPIPVPGVDVTRVKNGSAGCLRRLRIFPSRLVRTYNVLQVCNGPCPVHGMGVQAISGGYGSALTSEEVVLSIDSTTTHVTRSPQTPCTL